MEEKLKVPVFVGRFQPLHRGHLEVIKTLSKSKKFVIIIGSMQEFSTKDNPLNFFERKALIESSLKAKGISNFRIIGLPDLYNDVAWANRAVELIGTKNIIVYTQNNWPKRCFEKIGVVVEKHPIYFGISSTQVREKIRTGKDWKSLVPKEVATYLEKNNMVAKIKEVGVSPEGKIVSFIKQKVKSANAKGCIVGLSGGIDSSLVAALCKKALGKNAIFLHMPTSGKPDPKIEILGRDFEIKNISLESVYKCFLNELGGSDNIPKGNLQSRLRMCALYYFANKNQLLVVGTTNKSELELGYFTKYGDGGVDIEPIADLYKTEIFSLAKKMKLPEEIISSPPTAGLWEGQSDESELGLDYFFIDTILRLNEIGISRKEISTLTNIPPEKVLGILNRIDLNSHKLSSPEIYKIKP